MHAPSLHHFYAVGSKIPSAAGGFVVRSTDGGITGEDTMNVAGGGDELWRYGAA